MAPEFNAGAYGWALGQTLGGGGQTLGRHQGHLSSWEESWGDKVRAYVRRKLRFSHRTAQDFKFPNMTVVERSCIISIYQRGDRHCVIDS